MHKLWMEDGQMFSDGLCNNLFSEDMEYLMLFNPDGFKQNYWAYGEDEFPSFKNIMYDYTPLRQTIVLLICAMKGEL